MLKFYDVSTMIQITVTNSFYNYCQLLNALSVVSCAEIIMM